MTDEFTDTQLRLKWIPQPVRRWITPPTVLGAIVIVFQAGIWWNQQQTKDEMHQTRQAVAGDPDKKRMQQQIDDMKEDIRDLKQWRNGAQQYRLDEDLKRKGLRK